MAPKESQRGGVPYKSENLDKYEKICLSSLKFLELELKLPKWASL